MSLYVTAILEPFGFEIDSLQIRYSKGRVQELLAVKLLVRLAERCMPMLKGLF